MAATSNLSTLSLVFCCGICHDSVAHTETPAGELTYECTNPLCGKVVSIDVPEALARIADVALKLSIARVAA